MKKFLLPIVGLLLGSAAAQADDVSVKYYKIGSTTATELQEELFNPTTNELVKNEDGSYTLKKYQNSIYDLKFTIKDNVLAFPDIKTPGLFVLKDKDGQNCRFNLTTIKEYKDANEEMNQILVDGLLYSCINGKLNGVKLKSETFTQTQRLAEYEVSIVTYFQYKTPNGPDLTDTRRDYGAVVFNMSVVEDREGVDVAYQTASGAELFKDSFSPVEIGSDNSFKLSYFAGSEAAVSFKVGSAGADGKAPVVFTAGVSSDDPDSYQVIEGATFSLQDASGQTKTGALAVKTAGSYAVVIEGSETIQSARYKVYIDTKFGDQTGFAVIEAEGPAVPKGRLVDMDYAVYNNPTSVYETVPTYVDMIDETTVVVYNFGRSGYNIPFTISGKTVAANPAEGGPIATAAIRVADDYVGTDKPSNKSLTVKLPDGEQFNTHVENVDAQSNPSIYYNPTFTDVKYYKDRVDFHITFGTTKFVAANWSMPTSESGIADVVADENAPVEWYSLQGVRVNGENLAPGIYIKRQGSKAVKVLVK